MGMQSQKSVSWCLTGHYDSYTKGRGMGGVGFSCSSDKQPNGGYDCVSSKPCTVVGRNHSALHNSIGQRAGF